MILPYCYRSWAKLRLRHVSPWIRTWATEDMFAVSPGTGADAAWYRSAALREEALMQSKPFSGTCDDIWKAYDCISRETALAAALAAGFPKGLARAYFNFHKRLEVRNGLALGLGAPRYRALCIPQGCPLSNMFLGILMRPLLLRLRTAGTIPRLLADDLETMAAGYKHSTRMRHASSLVAEHLQAMGSRVSTGPGKSHSFASTKAGRRALRKQLAPSGRCTLTHWRDLGAHANISNKPTGATLTRRLLGAARLGPSIRALPGDSDIRVKMVHCKMLPMGIYGAEVSIMSDVALRSLRGAIFASLRSRCDLGANAGLLFSELAARGWEVDPELKVAHNRMLALSRACDRHPELKTTLHHIWELYREAGHPATCWNEHVQRKPIAPPGWAARRGWRRGLTARGPVGLLLQSAHSYALALEWGEEGPRIRQQLEIPVPLCQGPWDAIKTRTLATLQRARRAGVSEGKSTWQGLIAWDHHLAKEQTRGMTPQDLSIWRVIQSGQFFTAVRAQRLAIVEDGSCFLCGAPQQSWIHLWAECPKLASGRLGFGPFRPHTPPWQKLAGGLSKGAEEPTVAPASHGQLGRGHGVGCRPHQTLVEPRHAPATRGHSGRGCGSLAGLLIPATRGTFAPSGRHG